MYDQNTDELFNTMGLCQTDDSTNLVWDDWVGVKWWGIYYFDEMALWCYYLTLGCGRTIYVNLKGA